MKQFIAFIKKEFYHIIRDKRTLLIIIGIPIVQIILFGFAISTEIRDTNTAIIAKEINSEIKELACKINASEYFTVKHIATSYSQVEPLFRKNDIELAVVCDDSDIQIITDATDPNLGMTRSNYASAVITDHIGKSLNDKGLQKSSMAESINIKTVSKLMYNPQMKSSYNFVPGVMGLILMLVCAMMTSVSIVREKETGSMDVLTVSPMNPLHIIIAKTVPYMTISILNLTTVLLLSVYVLGVPVKGSLTALILVSLLFILLSLSLGLFISSITERQVTALLASAILLMIPSILLSGMIYPIESMPAPLQGISCVIPVRWYIYIVRRIMIEGAEIKYLFSEISILAAMTFVLITLTTKKLKR